ncbi:porin [Sphaerotilus montanus]|jgi:predicted porin|uniref:Putative porin n=1 Tax=Sphaerotilus montanus TaxID=522889 RepID=A0A7Y9QX21_9BURK|nr:porin [Sphaerotilus montanus]NYG31584.1 putative porin [Sphaerotilus montanus]NZD58280.1 porin [Sphaerotilus montanus]
MIKRTIALAVLATLASGAAFAQSSVTLYGRLNVTAEREKVGSAKAVYALENNSSRLGLKGEEDLGGGLKAGFILEHGFDPTTGTAAASFWGRQSEAYLSSKFGMVRIGNFGSEAQLATGDWVSMHNHDTGTSADRLYAYFGSDVNKVAYRAPAFVKNLVLEASTAEGSATTKRTYDLAANYELGALKLGAGYNKQDTKKQVALRATYDIGAFTVGTYVQRDTNGIAAGSRNNLRLAGMYTMGASEFHANVGVAGKIGGVDGTKATQATVGYNYNLSKRTKAYTYYTRFNDGAAAVYGGDFSSLAVGVRHNF